jgi:hypothetical protein
VTLLDRCAWCGAELDISWVDTSMLGGDFSTTRGRSACPTPGCGPRCPICRGQIGDLHGPHCGPIMAAKLGDLEPCTITRADCGAQHVRVAP